VIKNLVKL